MDAINWCLRQHTAIAAALRVPAEELLDVLHPVDIPAQSAKRQSAPGSPAGSAPAGSAAPTQWAGQAILAEGGGPESAESARQTGQRLAALLHSAGYRLPERAAAGDIAAKAETPAEMNGEQPRPVPGGIDRRQQAQDLSRLFERDARRYGR